MVIFLWHYIAKGTNIGRSPFSHLSHPNPNSYPNLTLTLNLTLTNPNLNSNPTLTLTLRRVTKVRKWTRAQNKYEIVVLYFARRIDGQLL